MNANAPTRAEAASKTVTSYDVALLAGVSQATVSRSFTPGASVSKTTRAKIMRAVETLGYRPNAIARSLITKRSNMVAIIVANIDHYPELTAALSRHFSARGLRILLFTIEHESEADQVVDQVWQYRVDGVIAAVQLPRRHVEMLARRRLPLVFINRVYADVPANSVVCDHVQGERLLVDRLVSAGHRSFGIISGPADSVVSTQRVQEALGRVRAAGIEEVYQASGEFSYESGRQALLQLARMAATVPDAVICANDMMAIGAVDAARFDLGLRVPDDVSVVGFNGGGPGTWASYRLVTIRQPLETMVEAAAEMLLARVEDPDMAAEKRVFTGQLVEGNSARI